MIKLILKIMYRFMFAKHGYVHDRRKLSAMLNSNKMKNNAELQKDIHDAIKWESLLNAAEIGVTVKEVVVALTGVVNSYSKKSEAKDAAKKVVGVKAVSEK
jgi:osmotically-inducible protein OsmY